MQPANLRFSGFFTHWGERGDRCQKSDGRTRREVTTSLQTPSDVASTKTTKSKSKTTVIADVRNDTSIPNRVRQPSTGNKSRASQRDDANDVEKFTTLTTTIHTMISRMRYVELSSNETQAPQSRPVVQQFGSSTCVPMTLTDTSVMFSRGKKVTIVHWQYKIFVVDLVSPAVCDTITRRADQHVRRQAELGFMHKSFRSMYTYTKMDLPCRDVTSLATVVHAILSDVVLLIGEIFRKPAAASALKPRSWKEPHLLKYQKNQDETDHVGVDMHYDGGDFTWSLMLSDPTDYIGGGTYFRCLRKTLKLRKGQVLIHPGALFHKGVNIRDGTRQLLVCFLDGFSPKVSDPSWSMDDNGREFENNVLIL